MKAASVFVVCVALIAAQAASRGADDLPTKAKDDAPDFVPSLELIEVPPEQPDRGVKAPAQTLSVAAAKSALDRARSKQQRWQQLAKRGVLSQAEAEGSALDVAKALVAFQNARVAEQREQLENLRQRGPVDATTQPTLEAAQAELSGATALAAEAEAALKRTRLMLAEANLRRQRLLRAAGIGSRTQLQRAEATLQQLQAVSAGEPADK